MNTQKHRKLSVSPVMLTAAPYQDIRIVYFAMKEEIRSRRIYSAQGTQCTNERQRLISEWTWRAPENHAQLREAGLISDTRSSYSGEPSITNKRNKVQRILPCFNEEKTGTEIVPNATSYDGIPFNAITKREFIRECLSGKGHSWPKIKE